jgi:two-component system response regulator FixJ
MARARSKSKGGGGERPPHPAPLIAIVDDDGSVRRSTARLIGSFGYRTEVFGSGAEFLNSGAAERAACAVLDVRMPEIDGLDVQCKLAERNIRIPIVFVSGEASDEEERRARSAGAVEFLRKPVSQASLRQAIESVAHAPARGDHHGIRRS